MFRALGAWVIDADELAHAAYAPENPGFDAVVKEFGREYVRNGQIDRAKLGELVFHDEAARRRLNAIVHPVVRMLMTARTVEAEANGADVVIHDVPLLFENGLESIYSDVVLVHVPPALQLRRLVAGRGLSEERAQAIIDSQMPIDEKRPLATFVIDNDGSLEKTRRQVEEVWARVRSL
jgi:dephospho-CoA kinase